MNSNDWLIYSKNTLREKWTDCDFAINQREVEKQNTQESKSKKKNPHSTTHGNSVCSCCKKEREEKRGSLNSHLCHVCAVFVGLTNQYEISNLKIIYSITFH